MIRLAMAFAALLGLADALALDMVQVNKCMKVSVNWKCPPSYAPSGRAKQEMLRVMNRDQALKYCECRIVTQWALDQADLCVALSRACEYGDI